MCGSYDGKWLLVKQQNMYTYVILGVKSVHILKT